MKRATEVARFMPDAMMANHPPSAARKGSISAILSLLFATSTCLAQTQAIEPLEVARRIALAGALDLALERVDQGQPRDAAASGWSDWELLRLDLWSRRGRDAEILKRVGAHRALVLPERVSTAMFNLAARSALRLNQPTEARQYLARVLLRPELAAGEYREARLAVITTYLADRNGDDAYQAMLRFQQDFAPLRREEAERFVAGLVALDRPGDAAGWLAQLDPASPSAAILRLRAGLIKPEAAIAHGRALVAKGGGDPAWALVLAGGMAQKSRAIEIEVMEVRLNAGGAADNAVQSERTAALWKLYVESGQSVANEAQLLSGDDTAWAERARRTLAAQPQIARALLGTLVMNTRSAEVRGTAQLQMLASLREAKLVLAALRLFSDAQRFPVAQLDPRVRLQLGGLAVENKLPADAVRYWQNLPVPAGMSPAEWQVRYLAVLFQAGMVDAGLETAKSLVDARPPPATELVRRMVAIASEALDVWHVKAAEALFGMLLPLSTGPDRVAVLLGLGRARELTGEFRAAADAYLSVAVLSPAPDTDREALKAREFGAINLAKAGMLDDARATYQWLARNAKDAGMRENAARALKNF